NKIMKLNGVSYAYRTEEYAEKRFEEGKHYGVIAQEVERVIPEIVKEGASGEKSVVYTEMIPLLIEAVKEQQKTIEKQRKEMETLKSKINRLEMRGLVAEAIQ
ncbi:MAG: tail fiber domain-containing protein, partial [Nitrospirae bacterium]|nr:tail fiber domain-containing protein [Nitrospirota bacterium]